MERSPWPPVWRGPEGGLIVGAVKITGGFVDISVLGFRIEGLSHAKPIIIEIPYPVNQTTMPTEQQYLIFWNETSNSWEPCQTRYKPKINMWLGVADNPDPMATNAGDLFQRNVRHS
eukprot:tig00000180_g13645.t1